VPFVVMAILKFSVLRRLVFVIKKIELSRSIIIENYAPIVTEMVIPLILATKNTVIHLGTKFIVVVKLIKLIM